MANAHAIESAKIVTVSGSVVVEPPRSAGLTSVRPSVEFELLIFLPRPEGCDHASPVVNASPLSALVPAMPTFAGNRASRADNSNAILERIGSVKRRRDHEIEFA